MCLCVRVCLCVSACMCLFVCLCLKVSDSLSLSGCSDICARLPDLKVLFFLTDPEKTAASRGSSHYFGINLCLVVSFAIINQYSV